MAAVTANPDAEIEDLCDRIRRRTHPGDSDMHRLLDLVGELQTTYQGAVQDAAAKRRKDEREAHRAYLAAAITGCVVRSGFGGLTDDLKNAQVIAEEAVAIENEIMRDMEKELAAQESKKAEETK